MRLLAVTHEASRTGSVRSFVEALPALRSIADELHVVVKQRGPLVDEIARCATTLSVTPHRAVWQARRSARLRAFSALAPAIERYVARKVVEAGGFDLVYGNTVLSSEYVAAAQGLGVPSVLHVWEQQPLTSWAFTRAKLDPRKLMALVPSTFVGDELEALGATVVAVLPGPLKHQRFAELRKSPWSEGAFKVVACGTVAPWKGTAEFLEAASLLQHLDGHPVEWAWVGGGPNFRDVRDESARRGLPVRWIGEVPDAAPYLHAADVLVVPSRQETLGLVVLEAAAVGTPTVAFAVGGVPSIIRTKAALAPPGSVRDLVSKLRALLVNLPLREEVLLASRPAVVEAGANRWRARLSEAIALCLSSEPTSQADIGTSLEV